MANGYIRKQDAIDALVEKEHEPWYLHKDLEWMSGVVEAKDVIVSLPPADVVPVSAYKQVMLERDTLVEQLKQIGKEIREVMDDVVQLQRLLSSKS